MQTKVKNSWIFLFFFILALVLLAYYFYQRPYSFITPALEISADFPDKPTEKKVSSNFSSKIFGKVKIYQLSKPGITYLLSITDVNSSARQNLEEAVILHRFFVQNHWLEGVNSKMSQPIFFNGYNGQTVSFSNNHKLLYGQYYLTTTAIVAIYIRQDGDLLRSDGRMFIDSLKIRELEGEFD